MSTIPACVLPIPLMSCVPGNTTLSLLHGKDQYFMLGMYFVTALAEVSSCLFHGPFKPGSG